MIVVRLMGGLGNQMFQYALGRHLAEIHRTELKFDLSFLLDVTNNANITIRNYSLNIFNIKENFVSNIEMAHFTKRNFNPISKFIYSITQRVQPYYVIDEPSSNFEASILCSPDNVYLTGYWQSEKYFYHIKPLIKEAFTFKKEINPENQEAIKHINNEEAVSVHIRRGDYITNSTANKVHGVCTLDYYQNAMDLILQKIKKAHFFFFSDDIDWVKRNITINHPATFISHNKGNNSYEDLRLMSFCKHNIIANSTFSWWGAWLNHNPDKIVIAPVKWYNDESVNTQDLIPEKWIRI